VFERGKAGVDEKNKYEDLPYDRLKLLWLLLKKRGIDAVPPRVDSPERAISPVTSESDEKSLDSHSVDPTSDKRSADTD
jgi:hypothetical protein